MLTECPHCGEPLGAGWPACPNCGADLPGPEEKPGTMVEPGTAYELQAAVQTPAPAPAPAPTDEYRHVTDWRLTGLGQAISLRPMHVTVLGRDAPGFAALIGPRSNVSRKHFQVEPTEGGAWVTDLGSTNGTYVCGVKAEPLQATWLPPGGELRLASDLVLRLEPDL